MNEQIAVPLTLMKKNILTGLLLPALCLIMASCGAPKETMSYFDNLRTSPDGTLGDTNYEIRIVPDDKLLITVTSINPTASIIYNIPSSFEPLPDPQTGLISYHQAGQPTPYLVSAKGDINFPVLGKIHVAGMTTAELAEYLYNRISQDIDDPIVNVDLTNFHINVLGEVNRPGVVSATSERFSILDAIARAGDLSQYAVRDNILLVRENNGVKEYHHLNLNDSSLFNSPYFYLKQNDLVIVEPNDVRRSNARYNVNNAYKIQVTSAVISACSVIASLVIALAVK